MTGKGGLYACEDPSSWEAILNIYQDVIETMGSKKKKLIALDQWYQEELPELLAGREEKYLTKEELLKVMEWKLTRGKFRPHLQQLVAANPSKMVEEHTRKAFHRLPDAEAAPFSLLEHRKSLHSWPMNREEDQGDVVEQRDRARKKQTTK
ncbi:putative CG2446 CG2446-PC protein [Naja naja]|nr:putative CG2446 CG2446-PC protein [Naja naja]